MTTVRVEADERTLAVQNASYRWAYLFLAYGLLVSIAWRAFARQDASWDLMALVIVSGAVTTAYQGRGRILGRRWGVLTAVALAAGVVMAAVIALARR
jgi:hypothetical protein